MIPRNVRPEALPAGGETRKVFVFCRPYLIPDFRDNAAPLQGRGFEFRFLTDGGFPGVTDTRARFYSRLAAATRLRDITPELEIDIVVRCRYLRNLPQARALQMLRAMASILLEELDSFQPDVVLCHMVDDYVTHLLAELARQRGVVFLGYAYSYFPGKIQATRYANGEPHRLREPDDAEVQQTLAGISQRTFRQNYLQKDTYTRARHLKAMLRYRVKRVVFTCKGWLQRDPLHAHYGMLPYIVERRHWRDFPSATDFHVHWREQVQADADGRPIVYFPLGYFPEATIDYWIEDRRFLDYERTVLTICAALGEHCRVIVKEHLHMLGARGTSFYRALRGTAGVISVPPLEFSNDVLGMCDIVLMGAGSIGVEAFIRGKPIASVCDRSYWFAAARATRLDLDELQRWPEILRRAIATYVAPTERERSEFVRECLRSTMRTERAGSRWPICKPQDLERALEVAAMSAAATAGAKRVSTT